MFQGHQRTASPKFSAKTDCWTFMQQNGMQNCNLAESRQRQILAHAKLSTTCLFQSLSVLLRKPFSVFNHFLNPGPNLE
jgi:hypothetical protein